MNSEREKVTMSDIKIGDVAATSFVTLYCHAIESQSKDPILDDPKAVEITHELNKILSASKNRLNKNLVKGKLKKELVIHIAIRAKQYDKYVGDFLKNSPDGIVVNIGCGLDSRFLRIDNGRVIFYDLDLPEVIEIKKQFFEENERYHFISSSVLDHEWMSIVAKHKGPFLFMAEGVFMYLNQEDVHSLILKLQSEFPGSELVCEVFNSLWLRKPLKRLMNYKMQHQLHMGKDATFHFGIRDSKEMEEWHDDIQFLDDWSYFDSEEKKLGVLKLFRNIEIFRKTQWTVHYKLN
jgi:methyltransferase (TIGR00027 family)